MIIFLPITDSDKKIIRVSFIYYLIWVNQDKIWALLNNSSMINTMSFKCNQKLGFKIWKIIVRAQKIKGSVIKIFEMVIANFPIKDKVDKPKFFQKFYLVADINLR